MSKLELVHVGFDEACAFVDRHHRHHRRPRGHLFSLGAAFEGEVVGVAIVGRPVARENQDGWTVEVTRLAVDDVERKVIDRRGGEHELCACSFLYGAVGRAANALGYRKVGTYTLKSESGVTLRAAGWRVLWEVKGRSWSCASRPRVDVDPHQDKLFWGVGAW